MITFPQINLSIRAESGALSEWAFIGRSEGKVYIAGADPESQGLMGF